MTPSKKLSRHLGEESVKFPLQEYELCLIRYFVMDENRIVRSVAKILESALWARETIEALPLKEYILCLMGSWQLKVLRAPVTVH